MLAWLLHMYICVLLFLKPLRVFVYCYVNVDIRTDAIGVFMHPCIRSKISKGYMLKY